MKFTLKSDYALNIIAIDKPPKYELKDTSCSTEKSSLLQVYCVRHQLFQCNFGIFIANEAAEENLKKKRDGSNKYLYELDFSSALKTARKFFMRRDSGRHIDIIRLMMKYVHAVKDRFRQFQGPLRDLLCQAPLFFINLNSTSTKFIFFT